MSNDAKKLLRAEIKALEADFMASGKSSAESGRIFSQLEAMPAFKHASCVLLYMAIPGEVETMPFIRKWQAWKRIVVPRVAGDVLELCEYDPSCMKPGYRGILEPGEDSRRVKPSEIDFAVIPGVAFAPGPADAFVRMGRGKGYYDRLLPMLDCPLVGVCFPFRFVESVPIDPWDIPLDAVVR